jgi:hypothetical protein
MMKVLCGWQFSKVCFKELRLSIKTPNNCVIMENDYVVLIDNCIEKSNGPVYVLGKINFKNSESLYAFNRLDSKLIWTQIVHLLSPNIDCWKLNLMLAKARQIPIIYNIMANCFGIATLLNFDL